MAEEVTAVAPPNVEVPIGEEVPAIHPQRGGSRAGYPSGRNDQDARLVIHVRPDGGPQ